jgi:predicted DNA-binding transcriptional regulator YafY
MKSSKRHETVAKLHQLLTRRNQRPLPLARICDELECSESTAKRAIRDLRDRFAHPLIYDQEYRGYRYDGEVGDGASMELPGLWFTEPELFALLTVRKLLSDIEPGLFEKEIAPLGRRVESLLADAGADTREVDRRIRITSIGRRRVEDHVFRCVADTLLQRTRLRFVYRTRSRPDSRAADRYVSPQRMVYYRNNWYLDAYDHNRKDLRIFAIDEMHDASMLDEAAHHVADEELDARVTGGYGIFGGEAVETAVLRFTAERAMWVSKEHWHARQEGRWLEDGGYELHVPYSREEELAMDVLRHGDQVEVLEPTALRTRVADMLRAAAERYSAEDR